MTTQEIYDLYQRTKRSGENFDYWLEQRPDIERQWYAAQASDRQATADKAPPADRPTLGDEIRVGLITLIGGKQQGAAAAKDALTNPGQGPLPPDVVKWIKIAVGVITALVSLVVITNFVGLFRRR